MPAKIGMPRGMYFYKYYPFIETFMTEMGAELVPSPETTKEILDSGVQHCIDDACLPVKIFHGHAAALRDKVDFLFIPRLTSMSRGEYICPKFGGLPEMVKYSVPDLPPLIDTEFNLYKSRRGLEKALLEIGGRIGSGKYLRIRRALEKADCAHNIFKAAIGQGNTPDRIINGSKQLNNGSRHTVGIVGHPYLLYDGYSNMNLLKKLNDNDIRFVTPEMVDPHIIGERCCELQKRMFWSSGKNIIGSALYMMDSSKIDGMLVLTAFGCGIDSLAIEYIERTARKYYKKPLMVLNIDEHTGDASFNTRLDAFKDLLNWRCKDENNLSPHGRSVYSS